MTSFSCGGRCTHLRPIFFDAVYCVPFLESISLYSGMYCMLSSAVCLGHVLHLLIFLRKVSNNKLKNRNIIAVKTPSSPKSCSFVRKRLFICYFRDHYFHIWSYLSCFPAVTCLLENISFIPVGPFSMYCHSFCQSS